MVKTMCPVSYIQAFAESLPAEYSMIVLDVPLPTEENESFEGI